MPVLGTVRRTTNTIQGLALLALPHGGQQVARRNAWASMSADSTRARARREAAVAINRAIAAHDVTAAAQ
jgi:hypothetical protein